ncbi:MAG: nuclear transport factor 2 family protein [Flavobacteriaceae bacterium]|nr:nuclear transport factor 2 family protein [Flavobacteriaceae bacterium]
MKKKNIFTLVVCTCLFLSVSVSAQKAYWASPNDSTAKKLIAMEKMWLDASCNPQPSLKEVFANDFQGTSTSGIRYNKEEAIASDTNTPDRQCTLGDVKIHFYGDTVALAYGSESSLRKGADGKEYKRCLVWTDTWLKRDGKWQIIAAQDNVVECPK